MSKIPYKKSELTKIGEQRIFTGKAISEIAFPLGGLGTGTISLGGRGNLRDFEVMNEAAKGTIWPFTFFALWAKEENGKPVAKVLEGRVPPPYRSGFGEPQAQLLGLPRFRDVSFQGEYPVANLKLSDPDIPVNVSLVAWNPLIPLNVKDSAIPVAIFEWTFSNPSDKPICISLAVSISNPLMARDENGNLTSAGSLNAFKSTDSLRGIFLSHPKANPESPETGTVAISTTWDNLDVQTRWYRGGWWDKCHIFWDDFSTDGRITLVMDSDPTPGIADVSSLVLHAEIPAGGSVIMPIFLTWLFPLMANPWPPEGLQDPKPLKTYAGAQFENAWSVAEYVAKNFDRLKTETNLWRKAVFESTLPAHVLDAITSQASIM
ncbi:MAG: GH116 family glycosyl-hydrolase, partial [Armatimonadota bacterium]|nr:GH116 family glycosyl-hydrolase [Armatimonadota bacterium]